MNISVVIPVYRGAETLEPLVNRLGAVLPGLGEEYEVIMVNDGSPDNSWEVIESLARRCAWVKGVRLMRNYGQHNATLCGMRLARHEFTVTMDQDLQHQPEDIPLLAARLQEGYDVVYGTPRKLPQKFWRNLMTASIKRFLSSAMRLPSVREISAFRIFRTNLREAFDHFRSPSLIVDVLLSWATTRFSYVSVDILPATSTNYSFRVLVKTSLLILTGYSTAPLRLASWLGFFMTIFGLGIFIYVLLIYFTAGSLPGFPFLASIIALFSGAQLFTLGIFGEYLARIFDRSMDRPPYVIREAVGTNG